MISESRNQRRSTPSTVRGAESAAIAGQPRVPARAILQRRPEDPVQELGRQQHQARPEDHPADLLLAAPGLVHGEHRAADHDRDQAHPAREDPGEERLHDVDAARPGVRRRQ